MTITGRLIAEVLRLRRERPQYQWTLHLSAELYEQLQEEGGPLTLEDAKGQFRWFDGALLPMPMAADMAVLVSPPVVSITAESVYVGDLGLPSTRRRSSVPPAALSPAQAEIYTQLRADGRSTVPLPPAAALKLARLLA